MADITTRLTPGLAEGYRPKRELGAGGMATVGWRGLAPTGR